jgi:hypothetical protein
MVEFADDQIYFYDLNDDGIFDVWSKFPYLEEEEGLIAACPSVEYVEESDGEYQLLLQGNEGEQPIKISSNDVQKGYLTVGNTYGYPELFFSPESGKIRSYGVSYALKDDVPLYFYDINNDGIYDAWSPRFITSVVEMVQQYRLTYLTYHPGLDGSGSDRYELCLFGDASGYKILASTITKHYI